MGMLDMVLDMDVNVFVLFVVCPALGRALLQERLLSKLCLMLDQSI